MSYSLFCFSFFLLLAFPSTVFSAKLQIIQASVKAPWNKGPILTPSISLCPDDLFSSTFSVECIPDKPATWAKFTVNNLQHTEKVLPYTLAGDVDSIAYPWEYPPSSATVKCELSNGEMVQSKISFDCSGPKNTPKPEQQNPPPPTNPPPNKNGFSCIKVKATDFKSNKGWVPTDGGMGFKVGDGSTGIDPAGAFPLTFTIQPPTSGRYALTLDMRTSHPIDHNDVWAEIVGQPLSLQRPGSTKTAVGAVKAYHNDNGRAVKAFTVDFDAHALSTKNALNQGQFYTVKIGGRSTKLVLFSVVLFRCDGPQCMVGQYWNNAVKQCAN